MTATAPEPDRARIEPANRPHLEEWASPDPWTLVSPVPPPPPAPEFLAGLPIGGLTLGHLFDEGVVEPGSADGEWKFVTLLVRE